MCKDIKKSLHSHFFFSEFIFFFSEKIFLSSESVKVKQNLMSAVSFYALQKQLRKRTSSRDRTVLFRNGILDAATFLFVFHSFSFYCCNFAGRTYIKYDK